MSNFKFRAWQKSSAKITDRVCKSDDKYVIVNACVGSGKTTVACNAFGQFISENKDAKTIQMFVTPRIRLCDQQNEEIKNFLKSVYDLNEGEDYAIVPVDCTKDSFNKKSMSLYGKHIIFVICEQSLSGEDTTLPGNPSRWVKWNKRFRTAAENGYKFGFAAFDEAHNYESHHDYITADEKSVVSYFKVMLLSGTPSAFQKDIAKVYRKNVCNCSPKEAIVNKWIVKPSLNLVIGDKETQMARAIAAVMNREIKKCEAEVFKPTIMINFSGIDEIGKIHEMKYFQENAGKKFHFVTLHSEKAHNDANIKKTIEPTIDGKVVKAEEAYNAIENIDNRSYFKDDLPIIVGQVQMLGEGINVSSFNACLTTTNSDKTAMQQIGRIVRNYKLGDKTKVDDGHANVYVMTDNVQSIEKLLVNLDEFELTDECFSWGDKLDISTSSGVEADEDGIPVLNDFDWEEIDVNNDLDITEILLNVNDKNFKNATQSLFKEYLAENDIDGDGVSDIAELNDILQELNDSGMLKLWTNQSFDKKTENRNRAAIKKNLKKSKTDNKTETVTETVEVKPKKETDLLRLSFKVWMNWVFSCRKAMKSMNVRKLWKMNRRMAFKRILDNDKVAEYLDKHLSEKVINMIEK